jgi:AraC family transcriptional regulator
MASASNTLQGQAQAFMPILFQAGCAAVRHARRSSRRDRERSTRGDRVQGQALRRRRVVVKWCGSRSLAQEQELLPEGPVSGRESDRRPFDHGYPAATIETRNRLSMDQSINSYGAQIYGAQIASAPASPPPQPLEAEPHADEFFAPAEIVRYQTTRWRGVRIKTLQIIDRGRFEYSAKLQCHLLVAVEQGVRYDGETFVEGLPTSTVRNYSHKLIFVPAGRRFFGATRPRLLTRSICLYIDPQAVPVDPDLGFAEAELEPRMLFEHSEIWETVLKLKAQMGSANPSDRMYAEALGGLLAHELLRLHGTIPASRRVDRGGLAKWQQMRVMDFMEEHLAEDISLGVLADLVRLSSYHFLRSFKRSFGQPPHRYWTGRRIERAKALLANPRASITQVAFDVGFSGASAFSATFHRVTGRTPTDYRRGLE